MNKLTRQGVRDLGGNDVRRKKPVFVALQQCEHKRMRQCRPSIGSKPGYDYWYCPDCDLSFDAPAGK